MAEVRVIHLVENETAASFTTGWFRHSSLRRNYQITASGNAALSVEVITHRTDSESLHQPYPIWNSPGTAGTWVVETGSGAMSRVVATGNAGSVSVSIASELP